MYKDKDKQREAQRNWVRQKRANKQGSTQGSTKRGLDIKTFEDLPLDVQDTINRLSITDGKVDEAEKARRTAAAIHYQHLFPDSYNDTSIAGLLAQAELGCVRVSKPGDADYKPMCQTSRTFMGSLV